MADLPVAEQTLVGRVTGGHVDDLPFADVTTALGLGKLVAVGHAGAPTWIATEATDWADVTANNYAWIQFLFDGGGHTVNVIAGNGSSVNDATNAFATYSATTGYAEAYLQDGAGGYVDFASGTAGNNPSTYVKIQSDTTQTDTAFAVYDASSNDVLEVTGDAKIGFYNHAPVAQQTGVGVSAAAIHAALVNLGLITA